MKKPFLVRHAKSSPANFRESDFSRPLNQNGIKEAMLMGQKLVQRGIEIDIFISSPALRARQTCEILCNTCNAPIDKIHFDDTLYLPEINSFVKSIAAIDNHFNNIVLVSHNPGITEFINHLHCGASIDNMPTGGMFAVATNTDSWSSFLSAKKKFLFFDYPNNSQSDFSKYNAEGSGL